MFERHSALAGVLGREPTGALAARGALAGRGAPAGGSASAKLGEVRGFSLVQVTGFSNTWPELAQAVEETLGALPEKTGQSGVVRDRLLFRTGSEQFWVVSGANENLTEALRGAVRADVVTVTSLSHSRTRIFVEIGRAHV